MDGSSRLPPRVLLQYLAPQRLLGRIASLVAGCRWPPLKNLLIRKFVERYRVDMSEALNPDPRSYPDFNAFFTRALKSGARPVAMDPGIIVSPVDGEISQLGDIRQGRIIQAKGHGFTTTELLADAGGHGAELAEGRFITLYLSPREYHRVHLPVSGCLRRMTYVPGRLFSVNRETTASMPRLFSRNERIVMDFDIGAGRMVLCMVGAMLVSGLETVWHGRLGRQRAIRRFEYGGAGARMDFPQGAEIGRFNMGSTVILLFEGTAARWAADLQPGSRTRMGMALGSVARGS